jgi:histone H3/H4
MTATGKTATEFAAPRPAEEQEATLARFEAAADAPESLRERVAEELFNEANPIADHFPNYWNRVAADIREKYRRMADAALRVITEDARR